MRTPSHLYHIVFASLVVCSLLSSLVPLSAAGGKPNVLLICVDDLKPTLGCYGDTVAVTPHIDELAKRGLLFERAYCNQAVCAPSRNALMTGLRPQTLGVYDLGTNFRHAAPDAVTLGQFFQAHGYSAEGLGKIYHRGHGNGDDAATWSTPHWNPRGPTYHLAASQQNPKVDRGGKKRFAATENAAVQDEAYADGETALEAVKRLHAAKSRAGQPFFLAVGFIRPHLPFVAPQKYWEMYTPTQLPMPRVTSAPRGAPSYAPTSFGELRNYSGIPSSGAIDEALTRHLIHGYYAATSYMDAQVGRVLQALDETGLAGNTIVVLWGDHGWHLGDHGMWCKHTNYEQAARIPLIISAPDRVIPGSTEALIETVDLYPTLAALAGLASPAQLDGIDQSRLLTEPQAAIRDHAIHVYPRGGRLGRAIRTPRYRLVEWRYLREADSAAEFELYDYETDPLETVNRYDQLPAIADQLKAILEKHPSPRAQVRK